MEQATVTKKEGHDHVTDPDPKEEPLPENILDLEAIEIEAIQENDRELEKKEYNFSKSRIVRTETPGEGKIPIMVFRVKMGNMSFYVPRINQETGKQMIFKSPFSGKWDPQFVMHKFHRIEANWAKDGYLSEYYVYNDTPKPVIAKLFQMTKQGSNPVMTKMTHIKKTNYKEYVALIERDKLNKQLSLTNETNMDLQSKLLEAESSGNSKAQLELKGQIEEINKSNKGLTQTNEALETANADKDKQLADMKAKLEALEKDK